MKIHVMVPFSREKNLGAAYNEACSLVPDGDWICLLDHDVMFLTPDAINIMYSYVNIGEHCYKDIFYTCRANRVHPLNKEQLYEGVISENENLIHHIRIAENVKWQYMGSSSHPILSELQHHFSGFLMLFPKSLWNKIKFDEGIGCLGVDTSYFKKLKQSDTPVYVMNQLYIWHTYRLQNGITNKNHLK